MARDLGNARKNKNDEFYTQFSDIQKEIGKPKFEYKSFAFSIEL